MAGKSNKVKNKKGLQSTANSVEPAVCSGAPLQDETSDLESLKVESNGISVAVELPSVNSEPKEPDNAESENKAKQGSGDVHLYPVAVKTQGGEKLELQLSPGDSVMDVRQFLLDAPETCFLTCYDLILHTKDGSVHHLEDYNEISEVADITSGGCCLEMVSALYDARSIRAHIHRTRELLSLSTLHASLSTSLALQYETSKGTAKNTTLNSGPSGDTVKTEIPELDGLGFMDDVAGSLRNLLSPSYKEIKCVESIVFSSLNPPPSFRRLVGDLIYLDVTTLEGSKYCITGTTRMFYVNSSVGNTLDPRPNKTNVEATTLIGLLQKISLKFKKAFSDLLEHKASAHPFENVQCILPPNSWLGLCPFPDHKRDAARAEDALTLSYGSELLGMQRDWNEELQSCREFPHTTPQERMLRDRALYKVTSDFVDAAISGAIGVISRCIPPINPTDPECFHMYVHNNIFFSFAVDADIKQLSRKQTVNSNLKNDGIISSKDACEKPSTTVSHGVDGLSNGEECNSTSIEEHDGGNELVTSDVPAEMQLAESEQATYASANNDLKGTKAYQEADVPGLYTLAMAIIDYRGHRVVAQSVLPGILQGDKSDSLLYGSVDNGKKICWNEDFHLKVLDAAKRIHLKEHLVLDGSGNVFRLAAPVECKGIVGSDDRHYLLDLMRVTPRDANYTGPGSRFCILRPELITSFCQAETSSRTKSTSNSEEDGYGATVSSLVAKVADVVPSEDNAVTTFDGQDKTYEGKTVASQECSSALTECSETSEEILFNPNAFTEFKLAGTQEELAIDEGNVRKVCSHLQNVVLPKFIQDLCTLEVSPMDGQTLTEALHAHGINVRYLCKVVERTRQFPHLWDLCLNEIVVRSAKHILKDVLRDTEDHDISLAISHFFNCLFGSCQAISPRTTASNMASKTLKKDQAPGKSSRGQGQSEGRSSVKKSYPSYMSLSSDSLWSDIEKFTKLKYQFELPEDARLQVKKVPVIRNLCQKVGITISSRKYDLEVAAPFHVSDILNLRPVVKHSIPISSEAKDLMDKGKAQLAEGMLGEAYSLFSEAFSILQQVTGPMHREVANCCRYLAMVLYHAGDMAGAILQQHKELIINERCLGVDHPDTAHSYGNMALFYHGLNQSTLALRHMSRALLLLNLSSGPDHPDVAATFINVAMMYQDIGKMNTALRYLQEALKKNERLLGEEHVQTAVCYHALAIAFNCMGAYKLSQQHEKKTYDILVKKLGEEDSRTQDSKNWLKTFKLRELQMNAQKQKEQALNASSAQKAIDILKANPDLLQAFQAATATAAGGSGSGNCSSTNLFHKTALAGETLPRGRGVDERAARAAAEARKKAAARGLLVRPHSNPVQSLPPLAQQLLGIINSGMSPDTGSIKDADALVNEIKGHPVDCLVDAKNNHAKPGGDRAPIGLGKGLGSSLDEKQQQTKIKVAH